MIKVNMLILVISFLALLNGVVNAGTVVCNGTIARLYYHTPGTYYLKLSSMNEKVAFCSTETNWSPAGGGSTISPETCKQLYATFLAAKATNTVLTSVYFDGDDVPVSCNDWGTWKSATIRYFEY